MGLFFKHGVHAAAVEEALVVLDAARDEYLCLPFGAGDLRRRQDGLLTMTEGPASVALTQAGLLADEQPSPSRRPPPRPTRTIIHDSPASPAGMIDIARALTATCEVRRIRRKGGIAAYIDVEPSKSGSRDQTAVTAAARCFWRLSPWLPIEGECLVRSALLMRFLARSGLSADWVFGVRLWPFMAHCWVQLDDVCLNDDVERLQAYTPLMCR